MVLSSLFYGLLSFSFFFISLSSPLLSFSPFLFYMFKL